MNFSADDNELKLEKLGYNFSGMSGDGLTSLLRCPLPSLDTTSVFSAPYLSSSSSEPLSFEKPFEDPLMEPVPLAPNALCSDPLPFHCPSGDYRQNLIGILDPIIGSKRSSDAFIFDDEDCDDEVDNDCLSRTSKRQRISHEQSSISEECTARFRPYQEEQWRIQFQKLIEFKLRTGHCCVPHSYAEDPVLARWVKRQRYQYKKFNDKNPTSTMTTRRIEELESVGFVWHSHHAAWQEKFNELKAFKQQTGHCNVPSHFPENVALSTWVKCQRRQYKLYINGSASNMTVERFQELESLGFVFDVSKK